jgi:hypothetical protein
MLRAVVLILILSIQLAFTSTYQGKQIRIVYSYNRKQYDSLEVIVNKNEKTIYQKNHTLFTNFDSTNIGYATKADKVEVILRGYKKDLYCYPHIERLQYPYYRMSYGLNFECVKLKT